MAFSICSSRAVLADEDHQLIMTGGWGCLQPGNGDAWALASVRGGENVTSGSSFIIFRVAAGLPSALVMGVAEAAMLVQRRGSFVVRL